MYVMAPVRIGQPTTEDPLSMPDQSQKPKALSSEVSLQQEWGGPSVKEYDAVRDRKGFERETRRQSGQGFGSEGQI